MDIPLLVPDRDVLKCRAMYVGLNMCAHRTAYQKLWFPYALGRALTLEETDEILSRINGFGPHRFEDTWASVERNPEVFWRSQL